MPQACAASGATGWSSAPSAASSAEWLCGYSTLTFASPTRSAWPEQVFGRPVTGRGGVPAHRARRAADLHPLLADWLTITWATGLDHLYLAKSGPGTRSISARWLRTFGSFRVGRAVATMMA